MDDAEQNPSDGLREAPQAFKESADPQPDTTTLSQIVCIGASAGGLEPIEEVIGQLEPGSSAAYVVIQHLSPDFKSLMDELLGRITKIPVRKVEDGMVVEPNCIYLIPPRKEMVISGGQLLLSDQDASLSGPPLPINSFLRSLAEEMQERAVAVILSGSGSDGSVGCGHIIDAGGKVFVQRPDTAAFDSMPASVVRSTISCEILTPLEIGRELSQLCTKNSQDQANSDLETDKDPINRIFRALTRAYGLDLKFYKTSTVHRRIARRREMIKAHNLADYAEIIDENQSERERLYFDLLINVTGFFRDGDAFKAIEADVIPDLGQRWDDSKPLRIWVPACATGEEAYSLAILLTEFAKHQDKNLEFNIFATDVHKPSLDIASAGIYHPEQVRGLTPEQISEHFETVDGQLRIRPELRKRIVFSRHDVLKDPPFTKMDLVSCRNLLIYFNSDAQRISLSRLHFALKKNSYLVLGTSESLGEFENEFDIVSARWRIYKKRRELRFTDLMMPNIDLGRPFAVDTLRGRRTPADISNRSVYQSLIERFVPDGFLVNSTGKLIHIFGKAGQFLELGEGEVTGRLQDLLPEHLRSTVSTGIQKAVSSKKSVAIRAHNREAGELTPLHIHPMGHRLDQFENFFVTIDEARPAEVGVAIDVTMASSDEQAVRLRELELELNSTEETLQTMIEELQASNEELQASNEELQSTNEELHSVNEELYTVSAEHAEKVNELTALSYDMDNLLKSLNLPLVFLNEKLEVRRFTPLAHELFFFSPYDIGRPINAIRPRFSLPALEEDLTTVLKERAARSRKVTDDHERQRVVRMQPYLTDQETCMGVIMTFFSDDYLVPPGDEQ